jgi:repressor LexA
MAGSKASQRFYLTVGENIKKFRELRNYSLEVLGDMVGVKKKTIQRYERGEIKISMNRLADIAEALELDNAKLLKGTEAFLGIESSDPNIIKLPILGFVPAGGPIMIEENLEGHMPLPKMLIKDERDFCLKIRGDSMKDVGINDGDLILVHPQPVAENGQTIIARIDGEVTCKRFYKTNGKCRLEPANQNYKPIDCKDLEIIGIVTKVIKDIF